MKTLHKIFWILILFGIGVLTIKAWYAYVTGEWHAFFPALVLTAIFLLGIATWKDLSK